MIQGLTEFLPISSTAHLSSAAVARSPRSRRCVHGDDSARCDPRGLMWAVSSASAPSSCDVAAVRSATVRGCCSSLPPAVVLVGAARRFRVLGALRESVVIRRRSSSAASSCCSWSAASGRRSSIRRFHADVAASANGKVPDAGAHPRRVTMGATSWTRCAWSSRAADSHDKCFLLAILPTTGGRLQVLSSGKWRDHWRPDFPRKLRSTGPRRHWRPRAALPFRRCVQLDRPFMRASAWYTGRD